MDGTGRDGVPGELAVCGDRIGAMGVNLRARARDTIDADGLLVTPGFIDLLGQSEYTLLRDGRALSKLSQGITTEITGEATSVVPVGPAMLAELTPGLRPLVSWSSLSGYFSALERAQPAINLGTFVSVGTLRAEVVGNVARPASTRERRLMSEKLERTMRSGAFGVAAALAYPPASYASKEELTELARVAAEYGGGYATHLRDEGTGVLAATCEAIEIGERSGAWVLVHHLKAAGPPAWGAMALVTDSIQAARRRGVRISADQYPYLASSTSLSTVLPMWAREGGMDSLLARLRQPTARGKLEAQLRTRWSAAGRDALGSLQQTGPGSIVIAGVGSSRLSQYVGRDLRNIAGQWHVPPEQALLDLIERDRDRSTAVLFSMSEVDVEQVMRQPWVAFGTDAGAISSGDSARYRPHPRTFGTFPRVIAEYVNRRGILTLPEAVRRFTSLPADIVGLTDRGILRAGNYADITVFNPRTLRDVATYQSPYHLSRGVQFVIVNGVVTWRNGMPTGARAGRGLRHSVHARRMAES